VRLVPTFLVPPRLDEAERHAYRAARIEQVRPLERVAAVAGAAVVLGAFWWDWEIAGGDPGTIGIRLAIAGALLALLAVTYTRLGRFHLVVQTSATVALIGGFSWVLTMLPDGFTVGLPGLALSIGLLSIMALTLPGLILLCGVAVALPNVFMLGAGEADLTVFNANFWLALAVILATAFWLVLDGVNRNLFLTDQRLQREMERSDSLLENILPTSIAAELKETGHAVAHRYENVTMLFADIVGFTAFARDLDPDDVVGYLNRLFTRFDELVAVHGVEKIKTIGDGYMVAAGVPAAMDDHARAVADFALDMLAVTADFRAEEQVDWELRIGIHSGSVVGGVIGTHKFAFDLWGDSANVASRLESTGIPGRIQVSRATAALLPAEYQLESRGTITLKNRGSARTYLLLGRSAGTAGESSVAAAAADPQSPMAANTATNPT
jgi:class 3 adenylate cyclase